MQAPSRLTRLAALLIPAVLAGCSSGLNSVPLGRWEGTGTWEGLKRNEADKLTPAKGEYRVTVTFNKVTQGQRPLVAATVLSDHPDDSEIDLKGVEVLMLLGETPAGHDGTLAVYADVSDTDRTQARDVNEEMAKSLIKEDSVPPARLKRGLFETRLDLNYVRPEEKQVPSEFTETFTFSGDTLVKSGIYRVSPDGEYIRWTERLRRVR